MKRGGTMPNLPIVIVAAVLALFAATAADAAEIAFRPAGAITRTSLGKIRFVAGETRTECEMTLRGNLLAGPIAKVAGNKIGEINEIRWANCVNGEIALILNLPWTIAYTGINGILPEGVTAVILTINNFSIKLGVFGGFVNCLYSGNAEFSWAMAHIAGAEYRTGLLRSLETALALSEGGFGCPPAVRIVGTFGMTAQTLIRT